MVLEDKVDLELDQILKEKFTSLFRPGYITVNNVTMPKRFGEMLEEIDNWEVNEDDVWICSFPKTGTTWTQEMVWLIVNNFNYVEAKENLGFRSPFLEVSALFDYRQLMQENKEFLPPPFLVDSLKYVKNQRSPVCIKTHLPFCLLPKQIRNGIKKPKIIYVTRNPKDTVVSYYHHAKLLEGYKGNFEEFIELFLAGKLTYAPFWEHLAPFWKRRNEKNILFLKFEDLKEDLSKCLRKVTKFLNKNMSKEQESHLIEHLRFENMKKNPAVNYELVVDLNKKFKLIEEEGCFMRSGKVGKFKEIFSPVLEKRFNEWTLQNVIKLDLQDFNSYLK